MMELIFIEFRYARGRIDTFGNFPAAFCGSERRHFLIVDEYVDFFCFGNALSEAAPVICAIPCSCIAARSEFGAVNNEA